MAQPETVLARFDQQGGRESLCKGQLAPPAPEIRDPRKQVFPRLHAEGGGCTHEGLRARLEPAQAFEDELSYGPRDGEVIEGAPNPRALAPDQVLPVFEEAKDFLDGEREAAAALE